MDNSEIEKQVSKMMSVALSIAREKVVKDERFSPFGVILDREAKVTAYYVEVHPEQAEYAIVENFRNFVEKEQILGAAICMNEKVVLQGEHVEIDTIKVVIESVNSKPMHGYQLYGLDHKGEIVFGELDVHEANPIIFT